MKRVILAGGSGYLGRTLGECLTSEGYEVVVLTRSPKGGATAIRQVEWDGRTAGGWADLLDGAAAVVNLAGKSVNCRYTPENRREIIASRVDSVRAVAEAIRRVANPPKAWVQTGSLALYGNPGDRNCGESAPAGEGFSADVCRQWEAAFEAAATPNTRKVFLRIGLVLGPDGGVLEPFAGLARWFLGGTVGSGKQWLSWIHQDDMNRIFQWAIERPEMEGTFNATGPAPTPNAEFMAELRRVLERPWSPPVPAWAVRIGAALMGTEGDLALTGRRCSPDRLLKLGFPFEHRELSHALRQIYSHK